MSFQVYFHRSAKPKNNGQNFCWPSQGRPKSTSQHLLVVPKMVICLYDMLGIVRQWKLNWPSARWAREAKLTLLTMKTDNFGQKCCELLLAHPTCFWCSAFVTDYLQINFNVLDVVTVLPNPGTVATHPISLPLSSTLNLHVVHVSW
jgi:hypothetical protein